MKSPSISVVETYRKIADILHATGEIRAEWRLVLDGPVTILGPIGKILKNQLPQQAGRHTYQNLSYGIWPGVGKEFATCEDAASISSFEHAGRQVEVIVSADGVSSSACSMTLARLLTYELNKRLQEGISGDELLSQAMIGQHVNASMATIAPLFKVYPYVFLAQNEHLPEHKREAVNDVLARENQVVASTTLTVCIRIGHKLYLFIVGDGSCELYYQLTGYGGCYRGASVVQPGWGSFPAQYQVTSEGQINNPYHIVYVVKNLPHKCQFLLSTDGIEQATRGPNLRQQFHRVLTQRAQESGLASVPLPVPKWCGDDWVYITNYQ